MAIISAANAGSISVSSWGATIAGTAVGMYTLKNDHGMVVKITNYGATVQGICVPDRRGKVADVVLGYDRLAGYIKGTAYFGAIVGRFCNRIAKGHFTLDDAEYTLALNNGVNSLHGGLVGFDKVVWTATPGTDPKAPSLSLAYLSKDGEEGYPGNLTVRVVYTLTQDNALMIDFSATTDRDTVLNITNHSYFNLAGAGNGDILTHRLMLNASHYAPIDPTSIPTGQIAPVAGTPFDFRKPIAIGARISQRNQQLINGNGYDHTWVLDHKKAGDLMLAARVDEPSSGRELEVWTTQPGVQFYCGNFLNGTDIGKGGKPYNKRYGFCLETQHFPDSPNHPNFPTTELKAGETFRSETVFKFLAR